ncbi:hypothetical protein AX16_004238 [Volvariella volvacea WC 439]|nr:hypothetical protein AX16_004238 [Volvariella volvacea WC 439]
MLAFATVGSTKFDGLVQSVLSQPTLTALRQKGFSKLVVQCGNSRHEFESLVQDGQTGQVKRQGLDIEIWKFKPQLQEEYERADFIISHAGSGTILDVLRMGKPIIVVPNPTLADNHQDELATALSQLGHLVTCESGGLAVAIENYDSSGLKPFPAFDGDKFRKILDEELGYI